jgi:hypothetical protein
MLAHAALATAAGSAAMVVDLAPMLDRQRMVAVGLAILVAVAVAELVRRRKLREEFSVMWVAVASVIALLAIDQELLLTVSQWIGASNPVSTLFFGGLLFAFALSLQLSVRLSRLTLRHRILAQRLTLLEDEVLRQRKAKVDPEAAANADERSKSA